MKRLFALSLLIFSFTLIPVAEARLGDDLAALEKRFGAGKRKEPSPLQDRGMWLLFDSVMTFEKNGIVITAGLANEKCVAIAYEVPATKKGEELKGMNLTEVLTLMAKNAGESHFARSTGSGSGVTRYASDDEGVFAKTEATSSSSSSPFIRATFYSGTLFSDFNNFGHGKVNDLFLRAHPPKNLSDF